jgi:hypothetical protein
MRRTFDLFVLVQPEADEGVGGDRTDEGVEAGRDGARAETSTWGASTAKTAGDDMEVDTNVFVEALTTDAAATPEVWMLGRGFILAWVIFVKFKMVY